jgi:hypothetical protein
MMKRLQQIVAIIPVTRLMVALRRLRYVLGVIVVFACLSFVTHYIAVSDFVDSGLLAWSDAEIGQQQQEASRQLKWRKWSSPTKKPDLDENDGSLCSNTEQGATLVADDVGEC